jgi:hypothetical protein
MADVTQNLLNVLSSIWLHLPDWYRPLNVPLYSSFFTVASILLAMQNFLVINLNRDIYSNEEYRAFARRSGLPKRVRFPSGFLFYLTPRKWRRESLDCSVYGPLQRLANYLRNSTKIALIGAIIQLAFGQSDSPWAAFICFVAAIAVFVRIFSVLRIQRSVVSRWLEWLATQAESKP